ncbi:hypothetical protein [Microbacterium paraoxydans]|uniref:Uncharacterized protein n=1 Tax=Microbacterium paraoxydans TaxID=199592 RepID=A0ABS5IRS8_9MICO|nr:hypothetical protein [Microbacterium paraoxydans]MBS0025618.1 hypothetical protein [Microbacterium paraoxydans]
MSAAARVLIAELDSPAQAALFDGASDVREAITELTGMLRIGMLVSSEILVTDAMLLDGAYFMALGPDGVMSELGATPGRYPLTITGVHPTLREGLEVRLANDGFRWSLPALRGVSEAPPQIRHVWEEWLRFVESGIIRYEQQAGGDAPLRTGSPPAPSPEALSVIAEARLDEVRYRSIAWQRIDALPLGEADRAAVRRWWGDAYLRMIAENAGADWVTFGADSDGHLARAAHDVELPLSTALVDWARDSTPATIAVAWDASRRQRHRLRERPSWSRMRGLAFAATQVTAAPSRGSVLLTSIAKLVIALCVVALAVPGLGIGSVDNVWTWVAFVGAIATTVPFESLGALRELLAKDPRARFVLHRGAAS